MKFKSGQVVHYQNSKNLYKLMGSRFNDIIGIRLWLLQPISVKEDIGMFVAEEAELSSIRKVSLNEGL